MMNLAPFLGCGRYGLSVLVLSLVMTACGTPEKIPQLEGPFGPGSGGPSVPQGTVQTVVLTTGDGTPMGSLQYDDGYFGVTPVPETLAVLLNPTDGVSLIVTRITGRPDTPCHFEAALLARDQGYEILAAGDRTNDHGLEFNQVNLMQGTTYQRFYCAELQNHVGVKLNGISLDGNKLDWKQVHYVLNSVQP